MHIKKSIALWTDAVKEDNRFSFNPGIYYIEDGIKAKNVSQMRMSRLISCVLKIDFSSEKVA
jgi:hypothetical protein